MTLASIIFVFSSALSACTHVYSITHVAELVKLYQRVLVGRIGVEPMTGVYKTPMLPLHQRPTSGRDGES